MKVLFVDIDGVLNTFIFRKESRAGYYSVVIDPKHLALLRKIVDETEAVIVLSSSWRRYWRPNTPAEKQPDSAGRQIQMAFDEAGLRIYDRTPLIDEWERPKEIAQWLKSHRYVKEFAIIDDKEFDWKKLRPHFVHTDPASGLDEKAAAEAVQVLNGAVKKRLPRTM